MDQAFIWDSFSQPLVISILLKLKVRKTGKVFNLSMSSLSSYPKDQVPSSHCAPNTLIAQAPLTLLSLTGFSPSLAQLLPIVSFVKTKQSPTAPFPSQLCAKLNSYLCPENSSHCQFSLPPSTILQPWGCLNALCPSPWVLGPCMLSATPTSAIWAPDLQAPTTICRWKFLSTLALHLPALDTQFGDETFSTLGILMLEAISAFSPVLSFSLVSCMYFFKRELRLFIVIQWHSSMPKA